MSSNEYRFWDEKTLEKEVINNFLSLGYLHLFGKEINRSERKGMIIIEDLKRYLFKKCIEKNDTEKIIQKLVKNFAEIKNYDFFLLRKYICEGVEINQQKICLIDYENVENNQFRIISQLSIPVVSSDGKRRRPDLLIYVNGFPLVLFELKTPKILNDRKIDEAFFQVVQNYRINISPLFKFVNLVVFSNQWYILLLANGEDLKIHKLYQPFDLICWINRFFTKKKLLIYIKDYFFILRFPPQGRELKARAIISPLQAEECEKTISKLIDLIAKNGNDKKVVSAQFYFGLSIWDCLTPFIFSKKITNNENLKNYSIIILLKKTGKQIKSFKEWIFRLKVIVQQNFGGFIPWNKNFLEHLINGKIYIVDVEEYFKKPEIGIDIKNQVLMVMMDSMFFQEELDFYFSGKEEGLNKKTLVEKIEWHLKQHSLRTPFVLFQVDLQNQVIAKEFISSKSI